MRGASRRRMALWLVWLGVVALACVGLPRYRIDNNIRRWMPNLAGHDRLASVVIVGFDRKAFSSDELAERLGSGGAPVVVWPITGDGTMDGLLVVPEHADVDGSQVLTSVRSRLGDDKDRVALAGPAVFSEALDTWSQRGLPLASGMIVLIGTLVLYLTTRRLRPTVEGLIAVFSSQLVLVGCIAWSGRPMDMMLSMTPPLMMAMGFSFAAHRAMRAGIHKALALSMATTCLGLLSFAFTGFAPIRAFALWGAVGIITTWGAVMLLVRPVAAQTTYPRCNAVRRRLLSRRAAIRVSFVGVAMTVVGVSLIGSLRVEQDVLRYFPSQSRIVRDYRLMNRELTGLLPFEVTVKGDADPTELLRATPGVRRIITLPNLTGSGPRDYFCLSDNDALPHLAAAQTYWQDWARAHHVALHWSGVAAQIDYIGQSVVRTAKWAVPAMVLVAGLAAWLIDRRWSSVLLSIYVNLFPVATLIIIIVVIGHPVGLATLVIASLAIGMAIDDTLHLLMARRALGSMSAAVRVCRRPCLGSTLAVAACMATFGLCPFRPTAEFGLLVALVVLVAVVGDLLLLPAAAIALGDR